MLKAAMGRPQHRTAVLIGFESTGKSALFRGLTHENIGEEANFRGSTVAARYGHLLAEMDVVDLPGIRLKDDSQTTQTALGAIKDADIVILVLRATHAAVELPLLLEAVELEGKRVILVLTFADKASAYISNMVQDFEDWLEIPVQAVDTRNMRLQDHSKLIEALQNAKPLLRQVGKQQLLRYPIVRPQKLWFEYAVWGRLLALILTVLLFALPVWLAYLLSAKLEPIIEQGVIAPVKTWFDDLPLFLQALFVGDYGIITLGCFSFLWAFPVVLLLGLSVALTEESGMKDRITDALDPWMRHVGLNGRDLIPVLSGFGCNVVAVFQSRACSACTRKSCVSLIAFGSACSYQIGASLSVFSSAGQPWLFFPYVLLLFLSGALHTRIWHGQTTSNPLLSGYEAKTFLQKPHLRAVNWRVRAVVKQFVCQAMPIFISICLAASILQFFGMLDKLSQILSPILSAFQLPAGAASAVIFSILRKDGILILNQGEGSLLQTMHAGQLLGLVYLASTLTACLVTLWTVRKELGGRFAVSLAGKQAVTSVVTTFVIMLVVKGSVG